MTIPVNMQICHQNCRIIVCVKHSCQHAFNHLQLKVRFMNPLPADSFSIIRLYTINIQYLIV